MTMIQVHQTAGNNDNSGHPVFASNPGEPIWQGNGGFNDGSQIVSVPAADQAALPGSGFTAPAAGDIMHVLYGAGTVRRRYVVVSVEAGWGTGDAKNITITPAFVDPGGGGDYAFRIGGAIQTVGNEFSRSILANGAGGTGVGDASGLGWAIAALVPHNETLASTLNVNVLANATNGVVSLGTASSLAQNGGGTVRMRLTGASGASVIASVGSGNNRYLRISGVDAIGTGTGTAFNLDHRYRLENCSATGFAVGAPALNNSGQRGGVVIASSVFTNCTIGVSISANCIQVVDCRFVNCGTSNATGGVVIAAGTTGVNVTVAGCFFDGGTVGFNSLLINTSDNRLSTTTVEENMGGVVIGNTFRNQTVDPVRVAATSTQYPGYKIVVVGNRVEGTTGNLVNLADASLNNPNLFELMGGVICDNSIAPGVTVDTSTTSSTASRNVSCRNRVENSPSAHPSTGIVAGSPGLADSSRGRR
jgi:hypothetical protein